MNPEDRVIADIDAFIDEQLAAGEPENGYDYGDPDYPECPHLDCLRRWHGEPTPICPGSAVLGPLRPRSMYRPLREIDHRILVGGPPLYDIGIFQQQAVVWSLPDHDVAADIAAWQQATAQAYNVPREFTFPVRFSSPDAEALRLILGWVNPALHTESPYDRLAREMTELGKVIAERVLPVVQELCKTWSGILAPVMDLPDHEPPREDGRPPLPRPSHTPPMWAVDASRSPRRRNHR